MCYILTSSVVVKYHEYEEIVVEHRAMKERQRLKAEQEVRENQTAIKVSLVAIHTHVSHLVVIVFIRYKPGGEVLWLGKG